MTGGQHIARPLPDPEGWWYYLTPHPRPRRLVVFVHGFLGSAVGTWGGFPSIGTDDDWWHGTDMLFVGYRSHRESIAATSFRLRERLGEFFPQPSAELTAAGGIELRSGATTYDELILVGHSLGGVVLRKAIADCARDDSGLGMQMLDAELVLFSPATEGFQPSGLIALARGEGVLHRRIERLFNAAPAYRQISGESRRQLKEIRKRTRKLAAKKRAPKAARARVVWANPEDVVASGTYETDPPDQAIDGTTHRAVCRPGPGFATPDEFLRGEWP